MKIVAHLDAPSNTDRAAHRHHRCLPGSGGRHCSDRLSGQDAPPHARMVSIDGFLHRKDVHDGYNRRILTHVPRSQSIIYDNTVIDAVCIGENADELDGNKYTDKRCVG